MLNDQRPMWALFLCLFLSGLLVACGGGSETVDPPASAFALAQPFSAANGTGSSYYPMVPGTQRVYNVQPASSSWNAQTQALTIGSTSASLGYNTMQYSASYCADFGSTPLFLTTYNGGNLTALLPPSPANGLQDTVFTNADGVQYIGEALNPSGEVMPGEAKITMHPVVGEVIDVYSRVTAGCGSSDVLNAAYHWQYRTIEHLDSWNGFSDVWHTGLIEFNDPAGGIPSASYNYWFARGLGMVGFVWNNPGAVKSESSMPSGDNGLYYSPVE